MLYELIKKENTGEKTKDGGLYDTSFNDKIYYDLVEKIHNFATTQNIDYAFCGAMALNLFYQKSRKTLKDLEMHINLKDLDTWINFFESNIEGMLFENIPYQRGDIGMNHFLTGRINDQPVKIEFKSDIEIQKLKIDKFKNINLAVLNTIRIKNLWRRVKDYQDMIYYRYSLQYFFHYGITLYFNPLFFLIKRNLILKMILRY